MSIRLVAAIDPGLDEMGAAHFLAPHHRPTTLDDAIQTLQAGAGVASFPPEPVAARLKAIGWTARQVARGAADVVIEVPATDGLYARRRRDGKRLAALARSLNRFHLALGATIIGAGGGTVKVGELPPNIRLVKADGVPKAERQELLRHVGRDLPDGYLPVGPRGAVLDDAWDAIWLGCRWILGQCTEWEG